MPPYKFHGRANTLLIDLAPYKAGHTYTHARPLKNQGVNTLGTAVFHTSVDSTSNTPLWFAVDP